MSLQLKILMIFALVLVLGDLVFLTEKLNGKLCIFKQ